MASKKGATIHEAKHTWSQAASSIFVASINKGQFPFAILGALLLMLLWRLPESDISFISREILSGFKSGWVYGYVMAGIFLVGGIIGYRVQRRSFTDEMTRVAEVRNEVQEKLIGATNVSSSAL